MRSGSLEMVQRIPRNPGTGNGPCTSPLCPKTRPSTTLRSKSSAAPRTRCQSSTPPWSPSGPGLHSCRPILSRPSTRSSRPPSAPRTPTQSSTREKVRRSNCLECTIPHIVLAVRPASERELQWGNQWRRTWHGARSNCLGCMIPHIALAVQPASEHEL